MTPNGAHGDGGAAFVPAHIQPPLPRERLLVREAPGAEAVPMDVLFVGGGPAGLAGAIELARLVSRDAEEGGGLGDIEIGVLEKSAALGEHCLSGAVVNPSAFQELLPEMDASEFPFRGAVEGERVYFLTERGRIRIPTPPTMRNAGNHVASICEIVRWLGERAAEAGVNVFTGFPADALLMDGGRTLGVRTTPAGLDRDGNPGSGYMPPTDLSARITVLAEGTRGSLTQAWLEEQGVGSDNPQIFALGVKELWRVERPLDAVVHTLGWPLPNDVFGGSFFYPMGEGLVSVGLVVGLDYPQRSLDVHVLLQRMKGHALFRDVLEGGEMVEWGGKTIPEGGWHSLPDRWHGDGLLIAGDAGGFVDVPSLKGIHYAMYSGIFAARAAFRALKADDTSAGGLAAYDEMVRGSVIARDLHRTRDMRLAFKSGLHVGGLKAGLLTLTGGRFPAASTRVRPDAATPRVAADRPEFRPDGSYTFTKPDAVFRSGNTTRDDSPSHLIADDDVGAAAAEFYEHMCPAGVYERDGDRLTINAPNCIDCKATDVLGPRWTPREGGSGPAYTRM